MNTSSAKTFLTLAISHEIYLTRDQRYRLAAGDSVSVTGISVPVWYAKGKTNEPAREVFCNYIIHNSPNAEDQIYFRMDGYEFNIPQLPGDFVMPPEISNEEWSALTQEQREALGEERYVPPHAANLLDLKDGGTENLIFVQHQGEDARHLDPGVPLGQDERRGNPQ
jgi:hypothetical protein